MSGISILVSLALVAKSAEAQNGDAEPEDKRVTKVYNIADLLDAPLMLEDDLKLDGKATNSTGGGFGGGGGGGGGFFRIPDNILPQFGGGEGGFGGGGGGPAAASPSLPDRMTREALETLLYDHLSDDETSWMSIDGIGGNLSIVASMLIVTQTEDVHTRLVQLLDALRVGSNTSPTVQVDVRITEVASDQTVSALTADAKLIEQLADDKSAARLSLRCDNHRVAKVSSGLRRSYIVSLVPVVGGNAGIAASSGNRQHSFAYQPVMQSVLLGLYGKIKPDISEDQQTGRIHLGIELASGPEEVMSATFGTGASVDRVEIETARLETSIAAGADQWTLAGSIAVTNPNSGITSGDALPHLAILVRWKVIQ